MIVRKTNPRAGRYPRAHPSETGSSTGSVSEGNLVIPEPCFVGSEFRNQAGDNLADAGRLVFIGVARHGLGTIAMPFLFRSFHSAGDSDVRQQ